jgi:hypothetical protein
MLYDDHAVQNNHMFVYMLTRVLDADTIERWKLSCNDESLRT